jgi:hypothetical protein
VFPTTKTGCVFSRGGSQSSARRWATEEMAYTTPLQIGLGYSGYELRVLRGTPFAYADFPLAYAG